MITYAFLQQYWWLIISLLGGLLVFLLFVQGGNALIFTAGRSEEDKQLIVNSTGRKWEFTFTTLVLFGGAFFASFPLFYSTSFSGAYWVWVLILITFVFQAVSYEFQNKAGNILGKTAFRVFLTINLDSAVTIRSCYNFIWKIFNIIFYFIKFYCNLLHCISIS